MKKILYAMIAALLLSGCHTTREIAIVAHQGFWNCKNGCLSQNSMASLRASQSFRLWGSEFDVNMTADSVLIVFHDLKIGDKMICESNWADFADYRLPNGEAIPTLDEYLTQFEKGGTNLVFELKQHNTPEQERAAVKRSVDMLKAHGLLKPSRLTFISFSINSCEAFATLAPGINVQYLADNLSPAQCKEKGLNGIDTYKGALLDRYPERVKEAHDLGMTVNCWTVDDTATMKRLIDLGVDQITTNTPDTARSLLKELGIKEKKYR